MARLTLSLLSRVQVTLNGEPVTYLGSDTARALLAYLVVHPGTLFRRDALTGLLSPEHTDARARHNLRAALSRLRTAVGDRDAELLLLRTAYRLLLMRVGRIDDQALRRSYLENVAAHREIVANTRKRNRVFLLEEQCTRE